ncbi:hypothetical protein [Longimicrobium sp.]|uniref:hypothetical protein n=1 Tax=Longimicrobium sp. TaxID=2029185 RepID=UPI003B3AFC6F
MTRITLRRALLGALTLFALAPVAVHAQMVGRLQDRDLAASGSTILYDAIASIHPEWLPAGGANRVAVFVNGTYRGDASELRKIPTDSVASVRLQTPGYATEYLRRYPAGTFDRVLLVATRSSTLSPRERFTVSVHAGMSVSSISSLVERGMEKAGYEDPFVRYRDVIVAFKSPATTVPLAVGGTINYRMRGRWGMALTGLHTRAAWAGRFKPVAPPLKAVSTTATTSEGAVLITADQSVFRVGVGPAFQRADWEWASAPCQCEDLSATRTSAFGAAGEIVASIPLPRVPVRPSMRVFGRYYPDQEIEAGATGERFQVGGFTMAIGLGLSTHF